MPKKPTPAALDTTDLEADVREAAVGAIEEVAPPTLKGPAKSVLRAVLRETERQPLVALLAATVIGYVAAVMLK